MSNLYELKQKSVEHRKRVAFLTSSGIMLVIVGIWVVTFPTRFPELVPSTDAQAAAVLNDPTSQTASPLQALRESLNNGTMNLAQTVSSSSTEATSSEVVSNGVIITDPSQDTSDQLQIVK